MVKRKKLKVSGNFEPPKSVDDIFISFDPGFGKAEKKKRTPGQRFYNGRPTLTKEEIKKRKRERAAEHYRKNTEAVKLYHKELYRKQRMQIDA